MTGTLPCAFPPNTFCRSTTM